ncbi:ABC-type glutathione transport system ATPase component [Crossiella equi]|uniref:ABC-type glutathione transport system ATPase component n=1 Tax=Crossiella equi TaxID=130796 RepID=A0ABS5A8E7_9PSEU|nr:hypothetical protein [Crossiella equi]MBP2472850.1 ABC-type glutathione transport system ATPase component [Crossiella equi]
MPALEVSTREQVVALPDRLRAGLGLTLVSVPHDLAVVRQLCDRVVVSRPGVVVKLGGAEQGHTAPRAECTRELLAAVPLPNAYEQRHDQQVT